MTHKRPITKRAFTLVELLTVVAIISLLIGILLPSLSRARAQARKVKVQSQLDAIGKGLEMFRNDHRDYPDSAPRKDRFTNLPFGADHAELFGAHWLARAMGGVDLKGIDVDADAMDAYVTTPADNTIDYTAYKDEAQRSGAYIELESAPPTRDDQIANPSGATPTERFVLLDDYGFPILYYKANPTGGVAFAPERAAGSAIYYQEDNELFTGSDSTTSKLESWPFKGSDPHDLYFYKGDIDGDPESRKKVAASPDVYAIPFVNFFHNNNVWKATGSTVNKSLIKPYNAESFILLSAGEDGIYGTHDDVKNFKVSK
jgi:prepilin-type N-terminal cleavage/methylation domain-containing protein